jgi:hypothetical protein
MKPLANESLNKLKIGNMQQQNFIKSWQKINIMISKASNIYKAWILFMATQP